MSEWREVTLSSLAEGGTLGIAGGPFGSALGRKHYVPSGIPVIRGAQLAHDDCRFSHEDTVFVTEEKARQHSRNLAHRGDIIVTQRGTLGQVGMVPRDAPYAFYLLSQSQMKVSVDQTIADSEFVYYALRSPETVERLRSHSLVAGVPHINLGILRDFTLRVPDRGAQRAIAAVLSTFDELIAINKRRIELLEDLARSLYREWFVRFRFPGSAPDDRAKQAVRAVSSAWPTHSLAELTSYLGRGIAPKYSDVGEWTVINQRCIRNGRVSLGPARLHAKSVTDSKQIRRGDVLVNSTGVGTLGRVATFRDNTTLGVTADTHVTIIRPAEASTQTWLGLALLDLQPELMKMGVGSTGQTELGRERLGGLRFAVPPAEVLHAFSGAASPILDCAHELSISNDRLAATRDLLLPRLVTGRLDISDVDLGNLLPDEAAA